MFRRLGFSLLVLALVAGASPALAGGDCYITVGGAYCDGREYVVHATWTNGQGCDATFDYAVRCCPNGPWQTIAKHQGQTLHWTPTGPNTCQGTGYQFKITINCEDPCTCNAPPGFYCEYITACVDCGTP